MSSSMPKCNCRKEMICGGCGEPVYQAHGHAVSPDGDFSSNIYPRYYEPCAVHPNGYMFYLLEQAINIAKELEYFGTYVWRHSRLSEEAVLMSKQFLQDAERIRKDIARFTKKV